MGLSFGRPALTAVIIFGVFCIILTFGIILFYRCRAIKTMKKLDRMLDSAINGSFTETTYDESRLSALEAKLNRYLCISTVSAKNLSEEKEKIKTLISDISHQTKTPLANILLYSQILLENETGSSDDIACNMGIQQVISQGKDSISAGTDIPVQSEVSANSGQVFQDCVKQIYTQSEKLNFLISALIKTSRLETGIISVKPEPDTINPLIEASLEEILPKAAAKNIRINRGSYNGTACFDRKWTAEALFNILDNAVKYTPEGGRVTISAVPYEMFYRIDIADTGMGIAEEEQSRIFGRFYRSREVNREEGVGIGLYLAREIISAQGGYIKVDSLPGKGSVFSVFIPR